MVEASTNATPYARRLATAMNLDGVLPSQLAGELGISPTAVGKLLKGTSKMLTAENHAKAVRALRVDSDWLALGIGEPRPQKMGMRDLSGLEGQLVMLFRGLPVEAQEHLLQEANSAYSLQHPVASSANPFPSASQKLKDRVS